MVIHKPILLHYLKISSLYIIGYILSSVYRPFQNSKGFFDFGLADSGVGLISIIIVYLFFAPPSKSLEQAKKTASLVLFVYLIQEIYCYFFPGFVGTFDFKDILYYLVGFFFIYYFDVNSRDNKSFDNNILK
jgi:hypothetical protein